MSTISKVIRVGDPTSHGGTVQAGAKLFKVGGIAVARVGDPVSCPIPGHENCTIAEGVSSFRVEGQSVAFENHKTTCGAVLTSTMPAPG